jgi:hypothetical protein
VTITELPTATISYLGTPFCNTVSIPQPVTLSGTAAYTGGTYSSTTGLTLDASTGEITPSTSTAGTYTVTYTVPASAGCGTVTATTQVTITELPTATISYLGTPFCNTVSTPQPVTLSGTAAYTGGTYSSDPALTLDASTGEITPSTSIAGSYTVTYTVPASAGCGTVTATTQVTITELPTATISYLGTPFCTSLTAPQSVTLSGTAAYTGGTYSSTTGLTLDDSTGEITPSTSTAGTYTVTYTIPASAGCGIVTATTQVTITELPTATISYLGTPFCNTVSTPQPVTLSGTATYTGGTYSSDPALTLDASTGEITPSTSTAGSYTVTYTVPASAGCGTVTATTQVTITELPTATISYLGTSFCTSLTAPQSVTLSGTAAYTGGTYSSTTGLTLDASTGEITPSTSTAGTYTVTYTIPASGGCSSVDVTTSVTITEVPTATISYAGNPFCITVSTPQAVTLNGTGAYTGGTYGSDPLLSLDPLTGSITPSLSSAGTYTVTYTIPASGGCDAVAVTTLVTIGNTIANPTIGGSTNVCEASLGYDYTTEAGMLDYNWSVSSGGSIAGGGSSTDNTISIDWNTAGAQTVTVTYTSPTGCSPTVPGVKDVTVNPRPVPSLNGPSTVCQGVTGNVYTTDPGMLAYYWYIPGSGTVTAGGTSTDNTVTITWTSTGTQPLGVNYQNTFGCLALSASNLPVSVNYTPAALSLAGNTICITPAGNGTITSTTSETGVSYQLYDAGSVAVQSPQDGTGSGLTWSNITPGTGYYVIGSATDNCTSTSNAADVLTYPVPVPSISGPTPACINSYQVYTTETGMTGYNWLEPSGGRIIGTQDTYFVTVRWDSPGSHTVSVNYTDGNNCTAAERTVYNVTVTPTVGTPTIITIAAGSEPTCQLTNGTTTTTYATTASDNTGFNWSLSNGSAGSIGATTGIMTWADGFFGSVDIQVTANGCNGPSAQVIRTVNITPTVGTPTAITLSAGVEPTCQLTNGTTTTTYTTTATNNTGFNWSLSNPSAGSIGATTGVMTWANGFSGSVDIQVTANGCNGPSAMVSRTVNITPTVGTPTAITVFAGVEPTCELTNGITTTTYATTATNNTGFNWSLSNLSAGSIDASTGVMTWADGFSGTVNIQVTANGCNGPSAMVSRTVNITPTVGTPTAITISAGTEPTCQLPNGTTTTTYATTATNNTGFNWSLSNPLAGSIDASTGVMTWADGFFGSVDIQVTANGCNGPSAMVTRTVNVAQTAAITSVTGTTPLCIGANATYTANGVVLGGGTGSWTSSNNTVAIVDQTGLVTAVAAGTCNIIYTITGGCNTTPSSSQALTVNPLPIPTISGQNQANTDIPFVYTTQSGMTNYLWTVSSGGSITAGGGTADNTITVTWTVTGSQSVSVNYTNSNGCTAASPTVYPVTVSQSFSSISGTITYYNSANTVMNNVTVTLQGTSYSAVTNSSGYYQIQNIPAGTYNMVCTTVKPTTGAINAADAALTNQWGNSSNNGSWPAIQWVKFFSGDASGNNSIQAVDASMMLAYFVNSWLTWAGHGPNPRPDWTFWFPGTTTTDSSSAGFYPQITVPANTSMTQNLYGLVTGDFNQSIVPNGAKQTNDYVTLDHGQTVNPDVNGTVELPVYVVSPMEVGAVSLILDFPSDKLEIEGITMNGGTDTPLQFNVIGNELRIGWTSMNPVNLKAGDKLLTLTVKLIGALSKDETLSFDLAANPLNELDDATAKPIDNAVLSMNVIGSALGVPSIGAENLLLANYPNPFDESTTIAYTLPKAGEVTLEIRNMLGTVVQTLVNNKVQAAGDYKLKLNSTLLESGMYMATLKLNSDARVMSRIIKIVCTR